MGVEERDLVAGELERQDLGWATRPASDGGQGGCRGEQAVPRAGEEEAIRRAEPGVPREAVETAASSSGTVKPARTVRSSSSAKHNGYPIAVATTAHTLAAVPRGVHSGRGAGSDEA